MFNKKERFTVGTYKWYYGWNLFWWKLEGYDTLNGLNVYLPHDPVSAGFVLQGFGLRFRMRWSKRVKRMFWGVERVHE
jgi:hypothetical protein